MRKPYFSIVSKLKTYAKYASGPPELLMELVLKHAKLTHAKLTKAGTWQCRRRVPAAFRHLLNQGEIRRFLRENRTEAIKAYGEVDIEFNRLMLGAQRLNVPVYKPDSPVEIHRMAERQARELGDMAVFLGGRKFARKRHRDGYIF